MTKIQDLIKKEEKRQRETVNLIASENYPSPAVLKATGSYSSSKYAEGYPGKRYYGGCRVIDEIEEKTIFSAKKIFEIGDDWYVNVQPYSGAPANLEVYFALLNPGDTLLGMKLSHGGHLSHGHKVTISGKIFNSVQYGVDINTGDIDYDQIEGLSITHKPKIIICGGSAIPKTIDFKKISDIAHKVGALCMADIAHIAGLIAAKVHPSPFPYVDIVTTTTHKTLRGPRGAMIFVRRELGDKIARSVFPGMQGGPHMNVIAGIGVALEEALKPSFKKYQTQVVKNAKALAQNLMKSDFVIFGKGTENHLLLVDLRNKNIDGKTAEELLETAGIIVNREAMPWDEKPFYPSGIRLGTPAITTRGMKEEEIKKIAAWISEIINNPNKAKSLGPEIKNLARRFPLFRV